MASYVVDGLVLPVSVGGHPVLDFCNTRAGWGSATPKEYVHTHAHLARWSTENTLVDPALLPRLTRAARRDPAAAARVVARAVALRSALYAVLVGPGAEPAWAAVNTEVRRAATSAVLIRHGGPTSARPAGAEAAGPAGWGLGDATVELPLLAVAWSAAGLLTSPAGGTIGACPGEGCGWVFTDPRGRRRWCSMAWCGNRNKARRHAERRRDATDPA